MMDICKLPREMKLRSSSKSGAPSSSAENKSTSCLTKWLTQSNQGKAFSLYYRRWMPSEINSICKDFVLCHDVWYSGCFYILKLMLIMTRSCYITIAPYVWSCFPIEKNLAAIIILNTEKYQGLKQFDWLNVSYRVPFWIKSCSFSKAGLKHRIDSVRPSRFIRS